MGTRNKPQQLKSETNYEGAFKSYDRTPEEEALAAWTPDRTLLDAGTRASFGAARQAVTEGGYSGITNPYARARAEQIALEELSDRESSAMADANLDMNRLDLQNKQFLAGQRRPQYVTTRTHGYNEQPNQGGGFLNSLIGGGLGLASAFI